jgi:transporter family-2 protein
VPEGRTLDRLDELLDVSAVALGVGLGLVQHRGSDHARLPSSRSRGAYSVRAVNSTAVAAVLAFAAGLGGAVQIAVQGRLGDRVGSLEAVTTAAVIGCAIALAVLLVTRRSVAGVGDAVSGPKWQLLGGVMSVFIVLAITVAGPRIGIVATTAFLIAAQFGLAALIDRYGWFGVEQVPVTWYRVLGIVLLVAGAALTLRR